MYSGKSVRPRMKPWGTPVLTGYSYEERFVKTFLNILGVTEILCNFWLVLEEKSSK